MQQSHYGKVMTGTGSSASSPKWIKKTGEEDVSA